MNNHLETEINALLSKPTLDIHDCLALTKQYPAQCYAELLLQLLLPANEQHPNHAELLCSIGNCYFNLEQSAQAEVYYKQSLAKEPLQPACWFHLSLLLIRDATSEAICSLILLFKCLLSQKITFELFSELQQLPLERLQEEVILLFENVVSQRIFANLSNDIRLNLVRFIAFVFYRSRRIIYREKLSLFEGLYYHELETSSDLELLNALYNLIRYIYWSTQKEAKELEPFNERMVITTQKHLAPILESLDYQPQYKLHHQSAPYHLAYIVNNLKSSGANAIPILLNSELIGQAQYAKNNFKIFVYVLNKDKGEIDNTALEEQGVTFVYFSEIEDTGKKIAAINQQANRDKLDVVIYNQNFFIQTCCTMIRLAPIQIYWSMGFNEWLLDNIDYYLIAQKKNQRVVNMGDKPYIERINLIDEDFFNKPINEEYLTELNAILPSNKVILGTHGRLMKISASFCETVRAILTACPEACYITVGLGDASSIHTFIKEHHLEGRFILLDHFVRGSTFLSKIDIFLDTFPITAGVAAMEALYAEKPIVHHMYPEQRGGWEATAPWRDPELAVSTVPEYIAMCERLIKDGEFRSQRGKHAKKIINHFLDLESAIQENNKALLSVINERLEGSL